MLPSPRYCVAGRDLQRRAGRRWRSGSLGGTRAPGRARRCILQRSGTSTLNVLMCRPSLFTEHRPPCEPRTLCCAGCTTCAWNEYKSSVGRNFGLSTKSWLERGRGVREGVKERKRNYEVEHRMLIHAGAKVLILNIDDVVP